MPERKCLVCAALVDDNKAFCPECSAPMEQEEQREILPDIGSLTKTFNLSADEYQQMLREMNLAAKPEDVFQQTQTIVIAPEVAKEAREIRETQKVQEIKPVEPIVEKKKSSRKIIYTLLGALILLIILIVAAAVLVFIYKNQILELIK